MVTGRIIRWNAEQGFGFIRCEQVSDDVFVHISDIKDKHLTPSVGDDVSFELKQTKKGIQAKKVVYPNKPSRPLVTSSTPHPRVQMQASSTRLMSGVIKIVLLATVLVVGYFGYQKYQTNKELDKLSKPIYSTHVPKATATFTSPSDSFKCDGRTKCSQMTSRAEANYFVAHCPNTEMDGDHDGKACENDSRW